jgi:hypothetical protein
MLLNVRPPEQSAEIDGRLCTWDPACQSNLSAHPPVPVEHCVARSVEPQHQIGSPRRLDEAIAACPALIVK